MRRTPKSEAVKGKKRCIRIEIKCVCHVFIFTEPTEVHKVLLVLGFCADVVNECFWIRIVDLIVVNHVIANDDSQI